VVPETQDPLPAHPCPPHWEYLAKDPPEGAPVGDSGAGNVTKVVCGSAGVPGSCGAGSSVGVPPSAGFPKGRAFSPVDVISVGSHCKYRKY